MSGFTPGPWLLNRTEHPVMIAQYEILIGDYGVPVFPYRNEGYGYFTDDTRLADARLIAAAPEMHGALEAADVDLDLLLMAIKAGDPASELEIRASDIKRRLSSALSRVKG